LLNVTPAAASRNQLASKGSRNNRNNMHGATAKEKNGTETSGSTKAGNNKTISFARSLFYSLRERQVNESAKRISNR
jgi:hypothetical protein